MDLNVPYCSDKYQYTMGKSFYDTNMVESVAVFNMFYRLAPDKNNWAVVSGVREVLDMIKGLGSESEAFFERFIPGDEYAEYRGYLASMKFTGNVWAMREGEIAFPTQPILIIEAPIIEAQVLETPLLCIMNHQMAVATKASRVTRSTSKPVQEFGSRRAHGPWAAIYGAKAAYIGGCAGSSNIITSTLFGVPASGTMAHSYVTSFGSSIDGEYQAFDKYIKTHSNESLILLVDTYDTLKCGLRNAIKAYKANGIDDNFPLGYGIRLDSGDLAYLSNKCRAELDEAGLTKCKIFATNSLDEHIIADLERQNAAIDFYGVGDAIATSKHNPCFGNVYKLVQVGNNPVLKRSEEKSKLINPGFQLTYRIIKDGFFKADVTCLRGDSLACKIENGEQFTIHDEFDETKSKTFSAGGYKYRILQQPAIRDGEIVYEKFSVKECRDYYLSNLNHLNHTEKRIVNPHFYKVDISDDLSGLKMKLVNSLINEIKEFDMNHDTTHLVVDMLYDFIDGTLACINGEGAVAESVKYINNNPSQRVLYVSDCHPKDHCSFKSEGGIWPDHCVEGTHGGDIHKAYTEDVKKAGNRPDPEKNIFRKGEKRDTEQYSGYQALNSKSNAIGTELTKKVVVSGVATEFCIKSTVIDLLENGFEVSLLVNGLAYVDQKNHIETIEELKSKGVVLI